MVQKKLKEIEDSTYAVTVKHLSVKQIKAIQIPLPPLAQQEAIVAEVEACQKEMEELRDEIAVREEKINQRISRAWAEPNKP